MIELAALLVLSVGYGVGRWWYLTRTRRRL